MGWGVQNSLSATFFEFDPTGITNAPDLSTAAKVHDYFGYGTWEAYGAGRVTIGTNGSYSVGSEGGESAHTLSVAEMPSHNHIEHLISDDSSDCVFVNERVWGDTAGLSLNNVIFNWDNTAKPAYTGYVGGSSANNNMQPYRTVYRWRRIA